MRIELLHPVAVHFAIGVASTGVLTALVGAGLKRTSLSAAGRWMIWIGTCFVAAAAVAGWVAEDRVPHGGAVGELIETHEALAVAALAVFAATAVGWLLVGAGVRRLSPWLHVLGLVAVGLILSAGLYGGRMVYDHGAAVERDGVPVYRLAAPGGSGDPAATPPESR